MAETPMLLLRAFLYQKCFYFYMKNDKKLPTCTNVKKF